MIRLSHANPKRLSFRWNGRAIEARDGDSIAAALYGAGVRTLTASRKFHRPRGLSGSFAAGVLGRVDGVPNRRLHVVAARPGSDARAQNAWPGPGFDVLSLARFLPRRWLRAGFEHPAWLGSGSRAFELWERLLRHAAGMAQAPDAASARAMVEGERFAVDTVVVGGGPAGRSAARAAAGRGDRVALVSRGRDPGALAAALGADLPPLPDEVRLVAGHEVFGLYRRGTVVGCAPLNGGPALLIDAGRVVLATGRRSCPPLVPGIDLPGVLDLHAALDLAHRHGVAPGRRVVLVGTRGLDGIARRFHALGVAIVALAPAAALQRVIGRGGVRAAVIDRTLACDAVIHAGPWRADPSLPFQTTADGALRLASGRHAAAVELAGAAAEAPEPVVFGDRLDDAALVCPCMDVTVAEIRDLAAGGETHVEVVKRLTGCGMGPCQGVPCWDLLAAALADIADVAPESFGHPSYRPPRAALTLAQAAGLADLIRPEP